MAVNEDLRGGVHAPPGPQIPLTDYENFEHDSKETPEYITKIRAILHHKHVPDARKNAFGVPKAVPSVDGCASKEALTFIADISKINLDPVPLQKLSESGEIYMLYCCLIQGTEWLLELLFDEVLDVYESERIIGYYTITINRRSE